MWVVAGLGNPGDKYKNTRHNIGFMIIDEFAKRFGIANWKKESKRESSECKLDDGARILLVKPLTYMNNSGEALTDLLGFYKVTTTNLLVVHDEVDLPFATIRLKLGGGDGGHNGIKSVVQKTGSAEFIRLRVGVGRPDVNSTAFSELSDWVLAGFDSSDQSLLKQTLSRAADAIEQVIRVGFVQAQNLVNRCS